MLIVTIFSMIPIATFVIMHGSVSSFIICIAEIVVFFILLVKHVKKHYYTTRYIFFVFAILMQVYGSLYNGEYGGFDFLFIPTALGPVLFFEKKWQIFSLFIFSITALISVKILYNHVEPEMYVDRQFFPYYSNIILSTVVIYFGLGLFKSDHLKYEQYLLKQKERIHNQNKAISKANAQLEALIQMSTKRIEEQNKGIIQYAYLNSHKARSPLARIMGLVNLTKFENLKILEKRKFYFNELETNAKELDAVLKEISQMLNDNLTFDEPEDV